MKPKKGDSCYVQKSLFYCVRDLLNLSIFLMFLDERFSFA